MFLTLDQVLKMEEQELLEFLSRRIPEATGYVDYKQTIYKGKDRDIEHGEFLKDITGFANAQGGHILIGVCDPTKVGDVVDAVVGIDDGDAVARSLENVASIGVDPRLSGFRVIPRKLKNDKFVLIAHIPPDGLRPHRVNFNASKSWNFFIRHGESIRMMTTQEIRDSVLSSVTSEQRAIAYCEEVRQDLAEELAWNAPVFFMQAMPLIPLRELWDVLNSEFRDVMYGSNRSGAAGTPIAFKSFRGRVPTVRGIRSSDDRTVPTMIFEAHRNGYVGAILKLDPAEPKSKTLLYSTHGAIFVAFADLCQDLVTTGQSECPYILRAQVRNTTNSYMQTGVSWNKSISPAYTRPNINLPDLRRDNG